MHNKLHGNVLMLEVDNAPAFVTVWDQFMNSALGKQMTPHAVFEYVNTNSSNSATHQLCWFSDDPAKLEANQGIFGSAKFMELFPVVNTYINNVTEISNYMGSHLLQIQEILIYDSQFYTVLMYKILYHMLVLSLK